MCLTHPLPPLKRGDIVTNKSKKYYEQKKLPQNLRSRPVGHIFFDVHPDVGMW
jgi:hypothetical protein